MWLGRCPKKLRGQKRCELRRVPVFHRSQGDERPNFPGVPQALILFSRTARRSLVGRPSCVVRMVHPGNTCSGSMMTRWTGPGESDGVGAIVQGACAALRCVRETERRKLGRVSNWGRGAIRRRGSHREDSVGRLFRLSSSGRSSPSLPAQFWIVSEPTLRAICLPSIVA